MEIHRKPGSDPVELFLDPSIKFAIGWRLLKCKLGMRVLMDVIPLDATMVKGSHGRLTDKANHGPLLMSNTPKLLSEAEIAATAVKQLLLAHVFGDG